MVAPARAIGCLLVLASGACTHRSTGPFPQRPAALQPGDLVAFVAPAGALDEERMILARQRLEERGYRVRVPPDLYRRRGYLAGEDDVRAAELMAAFADPEVKAVFPGTGNYGSTRILDQLDYAVIRANPKLFIGFSDLTALHVALGQQAGLVTLHSPVPMWGLGNAENLTPFAAEYFWQLVEARPPSSAATGSMLTYVFPAHLPPVQTIAPGKARGVLVGGNLTLINTLMGTPYELDMRGRIVFFEDIGERPYRIDRYFSQLRLAGKLDEVAGVLLGQFTDCGPKPGEQSLSLDEIFDDYFADLGVPVLANFPAGHQVDNATLPLGVEVELDADAGRLTVLNRPCRVAGRS